jgi:hypothetical protein
VLAAQGFFPRGERADELAYIHKTKYECGMMNAE